MTPQQQSEWIVKCFDCGWEKLSRATSGIDAEQSAKSSKAGHIGGGSAHYRTEGPCETVVAIPKDEYDETMAELEDVADRYDVGDFYVEGREAWLHNRLEEEIING